MPRLLSISRAARLVGTSRRELQQRVQDGRLQSFEGMIRLEDLHEQYPDIQLEDTSMLEHIEGIIEQALVSAHKGRGRRDQTYTPDLETLSRRVSELAYELAEAKLQVSNHVILLEKIKSRLAEGKHSTNPDVVQQFSDTLAWLNGEIGQLDRQNRTHAELTARDSVLRVIAAQVRLLPSGHEFFVPGSDTILEAGLSAGLALDYGCSNGNCGKCKARILQGEARQVKYTDYVFNAAEKEQGYILTCACTAVTDLVIEAAEAHSENDIPRQTITARVRKIEKSHPDITILHLRTPRTQRLRFLAGQSVALQLEGLEPQNFPIASCPCDDMNIQFHIHRDDGDEFACRIFSQLSTNDSIGLEGPVGHFVLHEGEIQRPLIFIAVDHGIAPVRSLIEHALTLDACEEVRLYWLARSSHGHYTGNTFRAWDDAFEAFHYTALDLDESFDADELVTRLADENPGLTKRDIFLAGPEDVNLTIEYALLDMGVPAAHFHRQDM